MMNLETEIRRLERILPGLQEPTEPGQEVQLVSGRSVGGFRLVWLARSAGQFVSICPVLI